MNTISIVRYCADKQDEWDSFVSTAKNGIFMHKRGFMDYHSDRFADHSLMYYNDKGNLIAVLPASEKMGVLSSHGGLTFGGFITNESMKQHTMLECFESTKNYMKTNGLKQLLYKCIPHIYHRLPAEEDLYALFRNQANLVKIEPSTTILLSSPCKMPKGRKAQAARAKREGVVIKESVNFEEFICLENKVLKEHHDTQAVHTADEISLLKSRFPENIQLWVAELNGQIIAATLLFVYDSVVHTQYMAANDKGREIGGLDYLIKTLIDQFTNTHRYFDFGISTEECGRLLNEGLISQKEGFGGRSVMYSTYSIE